VIAAFRACTDPDRPEDFGIHFSYSGLDFTVDDFLRSITSSESHGEGEFHPGWDFYPFSHCK
jgi:hypothetical protein